MRSTLVFVAVAFGLQCVAARSFGQPSLAGDGRLPSQAEPGSWALALALGVAHRGSQRDDQIALSPLAWAAYGLLPRWQLELDLGAVALLDVARGGDSAVTFGSSNAQFAARHQWLEQGGTRASVSFGVTAPLAYRGADILSGQRRAGFGLAAGMRGLWDAWLWAPGQSGASVGVTYDYVMDVVALRAEADFAVTLAILEATEDAGDAYGQVAAEVNLGPAWLYGGVRLQGVAFTADRDPWQFSVAPQASFAPGPLRLHARALFNLDPPLGVLSNGLALWGLFFAVEFSG